MDKNIIDLSMDECKKLNLELYEDILPANYGSSYGYTGNRYGYGK